MAVIAMSGVTNTRVRCNFFISSNSLRQLWYWFINCWHSVCHSLLLCVTCSKSKLSFWLSSCKPCSSLVTLMVSIPKALAALRFTPRSSNIITWYVIKFTRVNVQMLWSLFYLLAWDPHQEADMLKGRWIYLASWDQLCKIPQLHQSIVQGWCYESWTEIQCHQSNCWLGHKFCNLCWDVNK